MGREINVEAGNRLNLRDAVALSHSYFLMLKAAFEQRLGQAGGEAVMLDSVVEIATEAGYKALLDQAASILKVEGGFIVEPGPSGRLIVRRPNSRRFRWAEIFPRLGLKPPRPRLDNPEAAAATRKSGTLPRRPS